MAQLRVGLWGAVSGFLVGLSGNGQAAVVENITLGNAKALALGNAVTADPPGIDAIHFNPAGLTRLSGRQTQLKLLLAGLNFKVEFGGHDPLTQSVLDDFGYVDEVANSTSETSTIGLKLPFTDGVQEWPLPFLVAPLGGASYRPPGSDVTFATAVYTPMAAGYIRDIDDPGRFMGEELSLAKITYFSPSLGVKLNKAWSVGASLGLCPDEADLQPFIDLCGDHIGPYTRAARLEFDAEDNLVWNLNIGALWEPTAWFSWGGCLSV